MSQVILVRHGQAQTGAADEESYDNLSDLGQQQASWLGEYVATSGHSVHQIICGSMRRQRQTAARINASLSVKVTEDARLDEIDYFSLAASIKERHALELPTGRAEFLEHLPKVFLAWEREEISCPGETFAQYRQRVLDVLSEAETGPGTMLVTSGGIIGMVMREILGLEGAPFAHLLLQTNNASMHGYHIEAGQRRLAYFNAMPHLDLPGRVDSKTYI